MKRMHIAALGTALALVATGAGAQSRRVAVPSGMLPPAGLCRVWIDGVPPGRQPAATDCRTARANLRPGERILYGSSSNGRIGDYDRNDSRYDRNDNRYDNRASAVERLRYEARLREEARVREQARLRNNDDRNWNNDQRRDRELDKAREKREKELVKAERKRDRHDDHEKHDH